MSKSGITNIKVNDDEEADIVDDVDDSEGDKDDRFCLVCDRFLDNSDQCVPYTDCRQHNHGG